MHPCTISAIALFHFFNLIIIRHIFSDSINQLTDTLICPVLEHRQFGYWICLRSGPIFRMDYSILSAKGFRWEGGSEKPVRKDYRISKTRPLKKCEIHDLGWA